MKHYKTLLREWVIAFAVFLGFAQAVNQAAGVTLQWDRNAETEVVGYKVYSVSLGATNMVSVGTNSASLSALTVGQSYRFYVTAYTADGIESDPSNEVVYSVPAPNTAPSLAAIPVQAVTAAQTVTFTVVADDTDVPTQTLTKRLSANAPTGAAINISSGVFTWQPTLSQSPSTNVFSVIVTDNGTPALTATQSVTVIVRGPNAGPSLAAIPLQTVTVGQTATLTAAATDADLPVQSLNFSLGDSSPVGAAIDAVSGVFTWQPSTTQAPSTNVIPIIVADNGSPVLTSTQLVTVVVVQRAKYYYMRFGGFTNGTVSFLPRGLGLLGAAYMAGTNVTLTAIPTTGYVARGWIINGGYQAANPVVVSMQTNTVVLPYFTRAANVVQSQAAGIEAAVSPLPEGLGLPESPSGAISLQINLSEGERGLQIGGEMGSWTVERSTDLLDWVGIAYGPTSESLAIEGKESYGFYRVRSVPFTPFDGVP